MAMITQGAGHDQFLGQTERKERIRALVELIEMDAAQIIHPLAIKNQQSDMVLVLH